MSHRKPIVCQRSEHNISRRDIDADALKVLYRLARRGHTAFLVGGGVRDLLLGRTPKDFDVSTDASPNQIRKMFRNCFLIGRRFRLAHIKYGSKIIETSTFRRQPECENGELLQLNDNEFGTPEEDAQRRDFTINGLFYNVENFCVIDYVNGLKDLELKIVRSIGDPDIRFQEDPVRMLRAVRFASRLDFSIEENTYHSIKNYAAELEKASAPRMLEEIYRLFSFSSGEKAFRLLYETSLLKVISPEVSKYIDTCTKAATLPAIWKYLSALDRGDFVITNTENSLMLAALFFPAMLARISKPDSSITQKSLLESFDNIVTPFLERYKVPRKTKEKLVKILTMQHRFMIKGRKNFSKSRFVSLDWFAEALALHEIHLTATGKDFSRADEWRALWEEKLEEAETLPASEQQPKKKRPRKRGRRGGRRYNKNKSNTPQISPEGTSIVNAANTSSPAKSSTPATPTQKGITNKEIKQAKPQKKEIKQQQQSPHIDSAPKSDSPRSPKPKPLTAFSIMRKAASDSRKK